MFFFFNDTATTEIYTLSLHDALPIFQAICRVNRLDGEDKEYGYVIDYKDLFNSIEGAISDYTSGAFDAYDKDDVAGLLTNRLDKAREKLEEAREKIKALCEPVMLPRNTQDYLHYFCAKDTSDKEALIDNEAKRVALYKAVAALMRAYANNANELEEAGYSVAEIEKIKEEVVHYDKVREEVKLASGDYVDMKMYEPAMRYLLDTYIRATDSEMVVDFEDLGLIELIVERGLGVLDKLPESISKNREAMAETIENNIRKVIIDEQRVNPIYYEKMSELLDALIQERRERALEYQEYLEQIKTLAKQVVHPEGAGPTPYPSSMDTRAKRSLYDNMEQNEELAIRIDTAVRHTKKAHWIGNTFKEREVKNAIREEIGEYNANLDEIVNLVKEQDEYK